MGLFISCSDDIYVVNLFDYLMADFNRFWFIIFDLHFSDSGNRLSRIRVVHSHYGE